MRGNGRRKLNQVNNHQEECLNLLQEECAEVIQAASKIKRFGLVGKRLDSDTNLNNLETELGDVLALIELVVDSGLGVTQQGIEKAKTAKFERLSRYMHTWDQTSES
jgi:NTP pyrophosphatase (non-canonical NTP hydrolase)